jgi:hypothetical protein
MTADSNTEIIDPLSPYPLSIVIRSTDGAGQGVLANIGVGYREAPGYVRAGDRELLR